MELTLRYAGAVHSGQSEGRVKEKHKIRKELSVQLAKFWEQDSRFDSTYKRWRTLQRALRSKDQFVVHEPLQTAQNFWWRWEFQGYNFIPLLTRYQLATCELDIRLYRRRQIEGILYSGGDLDNRLKTFLDALQVPSNREQIPSDEPQDSNPANWPPLFCLVDDDSAITKLTVSSLKLLSPLPDGANPDHYLELDMDVRILPAAPMLGTMMLWTQ